MEEEESQHEGSEIDGHTNGLVIALRGSKKKRFVRLNLIEVGIWRMLETPFDKLHSQANAVCREEHEQIPECLRLLGSEWIAKSKK